MKQKLQILLKHPVIYGSGIVVFGNLFANFFNFLFNLFMSRNLTVVDYGTLASIVSMITLPLLIGGAIMPVVIKFAGEYFATGDVARLRGLYLTMKKLLFILAVVIFILFLSFIPAINEFFHIDNNTLLILSDIIIFLGIITVLNGAFLQAKLAFTFQVIVNVVNAVSKLGLGIVFVFLGYSVTGAVFAFLLATIISYIVSFIPIRFIFDKKIISTKTSLRGLFSYGVPSFLTVIGLTSFISFDIILVKHFFTAEEAGIYAGVSLVGRVIFYLSAPIAAVMFPVIVQKHAKKENFTNTFLLSLFLVLIPSVILTTFYFVFPEFTLRFFLKNEAYLAASNIVGFFGIFMTLYSVLAVFCNFYLSIKKTIIFLPVLVGAIMQIILIWFYHDSFIQIIYISSFIVFLLVLGSLIYYPYATKK